MYIGKKLVVVVKSQLMLIEQTLSYQTKQIQRQSKVNHHQIGNDLGASREMMNLYLSGYWNDLNPLSVLCGL